MARIMEYTINNNNHNHNYIATCYQEFKFKSICHIYKKNRFTNNYSIGKVVYVFYILTFSR